MATKKRPAGNPGSSTRGRPLPPPPLLPVTTAPVPSSLPCPGTLRRSPLPKPPKRLP